MSSPPPPPLHGVVVPVKPAAIAKSRLGALGDSVRRELVVSFAADTVSAALAAPSVGGVLAVTDDHALARVLLDLGAQVVPDATVDDLNASLGQAVAEVLRRWPTMRVAALCADLPCLRPEELELALSSAPGDRACFVADRAGIGTTFLAAPTRALFTPRFGTGSRAAHLAAGALELDLDVPTLRRDVDTPEDLRQALELGVGRRTAAVVAGSRL